MHYFQHKPENKHTHTHLKVNGVGVARATFSGNARQLGKSLRQHLGVRVILVDPRSSATPA